MRIAIDTQILFWYYVGKSDYVFDKLNLLANTNHIYVLDNVFQEFSDLIFKQHINRLTKKQWEENLRFINEILSCESVFTWISNGCPTEIKIKTRDAKDDKLLNYAIEHHFDLIVTNDKDLLSIKTPLINIKSIHDIHI